MKQSETINKLDEEIAQPNQSSDEISALKAENEALKARVFELEQAIEGANEKENESVAIYEREDWGDKLKSFLSTYPEAKNRSREIAEALMASYELATRKDALEQAYVSILMKNKTPDELIEDDEFLTKYVYVSPKIKEKIIADYVSEIEKGAPSVITRGGEVFLSPPVKPKTLHEAMRLAEKYLS